MSNRLIPIATYLALASLIPFRGTASSPAATALNADSLFSVSTSSAQANNVFNDSPTVPLKHPTTIIVGGEVERETVVTLAGLPLRSVAVKETVLEGEKSVFRGAYRYDGYAVADILDRVVIKKKNAAEYPRKIDLYVEISNDAGEKARFSWSEVFYPNQPHRILLATAVSRFVPQLTKELWPLPEESKLISGTDRLTARGVRNPTRITVKSFDLELSVPSDATAGAEKAAAKMQLRIDGAVVAEYLRLPEQIAALTYPSTLYGQGKGFLGARDLTGVPMSSFLAGRVPVTNESLGEGLVAVIAADGYRAVFSLSELINRNDRQEALLIENEGDGVEAGFSIFPSGDFFFDRAVSRIASLNVWISPLK